jgi:hypothetical protein
MRSTSTNSFPTTESSNPRPRVLLLTTAHSYRNPAFIEAADRLGVEIVTAIDMPPQLAETWGQRLGVDFAQPAQATQAFAAFAAERPIAAIIAVDDSGSLLAARAATSRSCARCWRGPAWPRRRFGSARPPTT